MDLCHHITDDDLSKITLSVFGDKSNPYIKLIKEYGLDLLNLAGVMRWPLLWVDAI